MASQNVLLQHETAWPVPAGLTTEESILANSSPQTIRHLAENDSEGLGRSITKTANRLSRSRRIALAFAGAALGTVLGAGLYFEAHVGTMPEHPNATQQIEIPHSKTKQIVNALGLFGVFGLAAGWGSGEMLKPQFARRRAAARYEHHMETATQWTVPTSSVDGTFIKVDSKILNLNPGAGIVSEYDLPDVSIPPPTTIYPTEIPLLHVPELGSAFKLMIDKLGDL